MTRGISTLRTRTNARVAAFAAIAGTLLFLVATCGQKDPTFRPDDGGSIGIGRIFVTTTIDGAAISLDGHGTGLVTPDTLRDVPEGAHRVQVFLSGYSPNPGAIDLIVAPDSLHTAHFDMELVQGAGSIAVAATYPQGVSLDPAAILLDGVATGLSAPGTVTGVASGDHTVTLVLPGFASAPEEADVTVLAGLVVDADFDIVVPKRVVCEDFSNYGCVPCVPADAALREALLRIPAGKAFSINPHLRFPIAGDPMYGFNTVANEARGGLAGMFQVFQMPAIFANGALIQEPNSADGIQAAVENELAVPSPLAIAVRPTLGASEYRVTVDVWAVEGGVPSDLRLFTCIVETVVTLDSPGPNGLSEYRNVLRHFFQTPGPSPDLGGEPLGPLAVGDRRTFEYTYPLPGEVDPAHLAAVAFAQQPSSRRVIQVGTSFAP